MARNCSSKPQWAHLEYTWHIENFWELRALASIEALEEDSGDVIWSRRFGDKKRGVWRLKVYPYGDASPVGRGHVSIFLALDIAALGLNPKVYAIFGCYVLDKEGNKIQGSGRSFTRQKFAEGSSSWGWSQFVKADDQALMGMLVDDTLTIKCDIDVFVGIKSSCGRDLPTPATLKDDMTTYLQLEGAKDVTLIVGDSEFHVNSTLLCSRSNVFRNISWASLNSKSPTSVDTRTSLKSESVKSESVNSESHESKSTDVSESLKLKSPTTKDPFTVEASGSQWIIKVTHNEVSAAGLKEALDYLLTDTCVTLSEVAPELSAAIELFIVSSVFDIPSLHAACVTHLIGRVFAKSDVKAILSVAQTFNCDPLIHECRQFLQYFTPELEGAELMNILINNRSATPTTTTTASPPTTTTTT